MVLLYILQIFILYLRAFFSFTVCIFVCGNTCKVAILTNCNELSVFDHVNKGYLPTYSLIYVDTYLCRDILFYWLTHMIEFLILIIEFLAFRLIQHSQVISEPPCFLPCKRNSRHVQCGGNQKFWQQSKSFVQNRAKKCQERLAKLKI